MFLTQPRQHPFLFGQPREAVWPTNPPRSAPGASTSPSRSAGTCPCPEPSARPYPGAARPDCRGGHRSQLRHLPGGGSCSPGAVPGAAPSFSAGSGSGHRGPCPERDCLGAWSRRREHPGRSQGSATSPVPSTDRSGHGDAQNGTGARGRGGTPRGRTWQSREGPAVNPPTNPSPHPPGRAPGPSRPPPAPRYRARPGCARRSRRRRGASPGPAPPPPGQGRPRRLLPTRETSAGPRARPLPSPPSRQGARGSSLRGSCWNRARRMEFKLFFFSLFLNFFSPSPETTIQQSRELKL